MTGHKEDTLPQNLVPCAYQTFKATKIMDGKKKKIGIDEASVKC